MALSSQNKFIFDIWFTKKLQPNCDSSITLTFLYADFTVYFRNIIEQTKENHIDCILLDDRVPTKNEFQSLLKKKLMESNWQVHSKRSNTGIIFKGIECEIPLKLAEIFQSVSSHKNSSVFVS